MNIQNRFNAARKAVDLLERMSGLAAHDGRGLLITESQESKSQSEAIDLYMRKKGVSRDDANEFVRQSLRSNFDTLRSKRAGKFTLGVVRMWCDGQTPDEDTRRRLNNVLRYVADDAHINEYTRNLEHITVNRDGTKTISEPLSAQQLIETFSSLVKADADKEKAELERRGGNVSNNDYEIVLITSFEEASEYADYTSWCVTHRESAFSEYTGSDGTWYFCLKNGYKDVPREVEDGCPLDTYGLSMIAVCVDDEGSLKSCTCRWNHDHGGNDHIMRPAQLSKVVGVNFHDTFVPSDDMDRGMSKEEYMELIFQDQVEVLSVNDHTLILSQDRHPGGVYEFDDSDTATYYLYDDWDANDLNVSTFHRNALEFRVEHWYAMLRATDDQLHVVVWNGASFDSMSVDEYFATDDHLVVVFVGGRNMDTHIITIDGIIRLEHVDEAQGMHVCTAGGMWFVQVRDQNNDVYVYDTDGTPILEFETPANGDWFDLSNERFECVSGNVYNLDGKIISKDPGFTTVKKVGDNWIVERADGMENVYCIHRKVLASPEWFNRVTPTEAQDIFIVKQGVDKSNFLDASNGRIIGREWGDGGVGIMPSRQWQIFGIGHREGGGIRVKAYFRDGTPLFDEDDDVRKCNAIGRGSAVLWAKSVDGHYKLYDMATRSYLSDSLGFCIVGINSCSYPHTGSGLKGLRYILLADERGLYHIFNLDNYHHHGPYDSYDYDSRTTAMIFESNGQYGIADTHGDISPEHVFDGIELGGYGCLWVKRDGRYNALDISSTGAPRLLSNLWFDAIVNGRTNCVEYNGRRYTLRAQEHRLVGYDNRAVIDVGTPANEAIRRDTATMLSEVFDWMARLKCMNEYEVATTRLRH